MVDYRIMSLINGGARVYVFRSGLKENVAISSHEISSEKFEQLKLLIGEP